MAASPTVFALSAGVVAPVAMGAAAVTDDKVYFVGILVATVVGVAGVIAWIDSRIDRRIRDHTETDQARHAEVMREIKHLRELFAVESSGAAGFRREAE